jgi:hypothetical protein
MPPIPPGRTGTLVGTPEAEGVVIGDGTGNVITTGVSAIGDGTGAVVTTGETVIGDGTVGVVTTGETVIGDGTGGTCASTTTLDVVILAAAYINDKANILFGRVTRPLDDNCWFVMFCKSTYYFVQKSNFGFTSIKYGIEVLL